MLFKISLKNIKKSVKDYSIYFFTLVFAVAMFYMFNSIDAQSSMLVLNNSKYEIIKALVQLIGYVSIFVSVILGFLIIYSNNFLIRRRKKEIGMYEILGMSKRKVSLILFLETILIGIVSLIVGLILGIFLSQFISIFISRLFEVDMSGFKFVFSEVAFNKSIIYFGLIFLLVIIFNVLTLSRYKLIDLINADRKNEQVKIRNKYVTVISFILSIGLIGYAYYLLIQKNAMLAMDYQFVVMIVSGAIGTFLLFFSLSGFLVKVFEKIKKVYYKDLNLFTLKQVNSRINTTVISTSVICLMLLLTIGMLSGSMSLGRVFNTDFASNNLTDYTIKTSNIVGFVDDKLNTTSVNSESFKKIDNIVEQPEFSKYSKNYSLIHKRVDPKFNSKDIMTQEAMDKLKKEYGSSLALEMAVFIIKESEYKDFMKLTNQKIVDIDNNEYLILGNIDFINDSYKGHYNNENPITINGKKLTPGSKNIIETAYENYNTAGNDGLVVVSDETAENLEIQNISLVGNFVKNKNEEKIGNEFDKYLDSSLGKDYEYRTRISMEASSLGLKTMVIFLGLYLGFTFAISSATVLAIGQLSESSDNKKRYKILKQIGSDEKQINRALFTQIAITFTFPLIVALIHSYFGLRELNTLLISVGSVDLTSNILITTIFMLVVYGGYFLLTYFCSKNIIKND